MLCSTKLQNNYYQLVHFIAITAQAVLHSLAEIKVCIFFKSHTYSNFNMPFYLFWDPFWRWMNSGILFLSKNYKSERNRFKISTISRKWTTQFLLTSVDKTTVQRPAFAWFGFNWHCKYFHSQKYKFSIWYSLQWFCCTSTVFWRYIIAMWLSLDCQEMMEEVYVPICFCICICIGQIQSKLNSWLVTYILLRPYYFERVSKWSFVSQ